MDGAENDIPISNDDNDSYELEEQRIQATTEAAEEETVSADTMPEDSQNDQSNSIAPENMYQSSDPPLLLTDMPNLDCPLALLEHNFAILRLPDFEGTPTIPVCISCRTIINSADYHRTRRHQCNTNNADPPNTPPANPGNPDISLPDQELPEDVDEYPNLPGANALDPDDVAPGGRQRRDLLQITRPLNPSTRLGVTYEITSAKIKASLSRSSRHGRLASFQPSRSFPSKMVMVALSTTVLMHMKIQIGRVGT